MINVFTNDAPGTGTVGDEDGPMTCRDCGVDCEEGDKLPTGGYRCVRCDDYRNACREQGDWS